MKQLWEKFINRLVKGGKRGGLRWHDVAEARRSEFFRWFSLVETERAKDGNGDTVASFRPAGEKFRHLVRLDAELDEKERINCLRLSLDKSFVEHARDGLFARDIARSFLRSAVSQPDAGEVAALADEIDRRHNFPMITRGPSPQAELSATPTPGFQVFVGHQQFFEAVYSACSLSIEQTRSEARAIVSITLRTSP